MKTLENEKGKISRNLNGHNFSLGGLIHSHNISTRSKLNNGTSREIQMVINNFSKEGQIQAGNISKRSKLNNGSSREIQMVITFDSDIQFRRILYRDARN